MRSLRVRRLLVTTSCALLGFGLAACDHAGASPPGSSPPIVSSAAPGRPERPEPPSPPPAPLRKPQPDSAGIYARLERDLTACYEQGRKATPEMRDGRITLNASIGAAGVPTCVIPSDHTGLTQDVEDCMSARFAKEKFDDGAPWSATVPIVLRAGALKLGERKVDAAVIESVETLRMPDAFDVLESLEPDLQACVRGIDRKSAPKSMLVAARVGADGRPQCALAASAGALPATLGDCAAGVLRGAKFPPPKRGSGLVVVPLLISP